MQPKSRKMGHRPSEMPMPLSKQCNAVSGCKCIHATIHPTILHAGHNRQNRHLFTMFWSDKSQLCLSCCQTSSMTTERLLQACPLCDHLWHYFWLAEARKLFRMSCCAQSLLSREAVSVWVIDKKRKYCMERLTAQKDVWGCLSWRDTQQSLTLPLSKCPK